MTDVSLSGANDFFAVSKRLKAAGEKDLRKALNKGLQQGAKPIIAATRAKARSSLPRRGGLAEQVAREPQRVQVRTGAATAGVRIVVGKRRGAARGADEGVIRHPVFGRPDSFVAQRVTPGWFSETGKQQASAVRDELVKVIDDMAQQIARGR